MRLTYASEYEVGERFCNERGLRQLRGVGRLGCRWVWGLPLGGQLEADGQPEGATCILDAGGESLLGIQSLCSNERFVRINGGQRFRTGGGLWGVTRLGVVSLVHLPIFR